MARMRQLKKDGNVYFEDDSYGPINPMWANCPKLMAIQDPNIAHWYRNDFDHYEESDWQFDETNAGSEALADVAGGVLLITTDTAENDGAQYQQSGEAWKLVQSKPLWFEIRLAVGEATQTDFIVGLCITDTSLIAGLSDGIYFLKNDGDRDIDYHCEKGSADSTADTGIDVVADTYYRYGLYWNGDNTVQYWLDGVLRGSSTSNIPDDQELAISFGILDGSGGGKTLSLDNIECFQIR